MRLPPFASLLTLAGGFVLSGYVVAQGQDEPREILVHTRGNVMETIRQLPRYVCTQTVDRTRYEPADPEYGTGGVHRIRSCDATVAATRLSAFRRHPSSADRLRLDVAVTQDRPGLESEMYSWAGENHFSEHDLFDFVRDGAVSTGSFSSILASIFGNNAARFSYDGDATVGGRLLSEFSFRIQQEKSQYLYIYGEGRQAEIPVGYQGTILVDPKNADLVRLSIRTEELPVETGACELTHELDYARVHLNGREFLLPSETRGTIIHTDGTEAVNRIHYSACREFLGESNVRYESPGEAAGSAPVERNSPTASFSLPSGLPFKVIFPGAIDTATAAAGDPIKGRLETAIRDRSDKVLVPEGTPVGGRILRVERVFPKPAPLDARMNAHNQPPPSLVIQVRLETLEMGGIAQPFKASFDSGVHRFLKQTTPFSVRVDIGSVDELHAPAKDSSIATFDFWDSNPEHSVKTGLVSSWLTAK